MEHWSLIGCHALKSFHAAWTNLTSFFHESADVPDVYLSVFTPPDPQEQRQRRQRWPPLRVFFSARTLAGRWVCWTNSEDHGGLKCRWIALCLLADVFTLLTVLALLLSYLSVFFQQCAEARRPDRFWKNGKKRKSLQCVYITSRFRKRRRERKGKKKKAFWAPLCPTSDNPK